MACTVVPLYFWSAFRSTLAYGIWRRASCTRFAQGRRDAVSTRFNSCVCDVSTFSERVAASAHGRRPMPAGAGIITGG